MSSPEPSPAEVALDGEKEFRPRADGHRRSYRKRAGDGGSESDGEPPAGEGKARRHKQQSSTPPARGQDAPPVGKRGMAPREVADEQLGDGDRTRTGDRRDKGGQYDRERWVDRDDEGYGKGKWGGDRGDDGYGQGKWRDRGDDGYNGGGRRGGWRGRGIPYYEHDGGRFGRGRGRPWNEDGYSKGNDSKGYNSKGYDSKGYDRDGYRSYDNDEYGGGRSGRGRGWVRGGLPDRGRGRYAEDYYGRGPHRAPHFDAGPDGSPRAGPGRGGYGGHGGRWGGRYDNALGRGYGRGRGWDPSYRGRGRGPPYGGRYDGGGGIDRWRGGAPDFVDDDRWNPEADYDDEYETYSPRREAAAGREASNISGRDGDGNADSRRAASGKRSRTSSQDGGGGGDNRYAGEGTKARGRSPRREKVDEEDGPSVSREGSRSEREGRDARRVENSGADRSQQARQQGPFEKGHDRREKWPGKPSGSYGEQRRGSDRVPKAGGKPPASSREPSSKEVSEGGYQLPGLAAYSKKSAQHSDGGDSGSDAEAPSARGPLRRQAMQDAPREYRGSGPEGDVEKRRVVDKDAHMEDADDSRNIAEQNLKTHLGRRHARVARDEGEDYDVDANRNRSATARQACPAGGERQAVQQYRDGYHNDSMDADRNAPLRGQGRDAGRDRSLVRNISEQHEPAQWNKAADNKGRSSKGGVSNKLEGKDGATGRGMDDEAALKELPADVDDKPAFKVTAAVQTRSQDDKLDVGGKERRQQVEAKSGTGKDDAGAEKSARHATTVPVKNPSGDLVYLKKKRTVASSSSSSSSGSDSSTSSSSRSKDTDIGGDGAELQRQDMRRKVAQDPLLARQVKSDARRKQPISNGQEPDRKVERESHSRRKAELGENEEGYSAHGPQRGVARGEDRGASVWQSSSRKDSAEDAGRSGPYGAGMDEPSARNRGDAGTDLQDLYSPRGQSPPSTSLQLATEVRSRGGKRSLAAGTDGMRPDDRRPERDVKERYGQQERDTVGHESKRRKGRSRLRDSTADAEGNIECDVARGPSRMEVDERDSHSDLKQLTSPKSALKDEPSAGGSGLKQPSSTKAEIEEGRQAEGRKQLVSPSRSARKHERCHRGQDSSWNAIDVDTTVLLGRVVADVRRPDDAEDDDALGEHHHSDVDSDHGAGGRRHRSKLASPKSRSDQVQAADEHAEVGAKIRKKLESEPAAESTGLASELAVCDRHELSESGRRVLSVIDKDTADGGRPVDAVTVAKGHSVGNVAAMDVDEDGSKGLSANIEVEAKDMEPIAAVASAAVSKVDVKNVTKEKDLVGKEDGSMLMEKDLEKPRVVTEFPEAVASDEVGPKEVQQRGTQPVDDERPALKHVEDEDLQKRQKDGTEEAAPAGEHLPFEPVRRGNKTAAARSEGKSRSPSGSGGRRNRSRSSSSDSSSSDSSSGSSSDDDEQQRVSTRDVKQSTRPNLQNVPSPSKDKLKEGMKDSKAKPEQARKARASRASSPSTKQTRGSSSGSSSRSHSSRSRGGSSSSGSPVRKRRDLSRSHSSASRSTSGGSSDRRRSRSPGRKGDSNGRDRGRQNSRSRSPIRRSELRNRSPPHYGRGGYGRGMGRGGDGWGRGRGRFDPRNGGYGDRYHDRREYGDLRDGEYGRRGSPSGYRGDDRQGGRGWNGGFRGRGRYGWNDGDSRSYGGRGGGRGDFHRDFGPRSRGLDDKGEYRGDGTPRGRDSPLAGGQFDRRDRRQEGSFDARKDKRGDDRSGDEERDNHRAGQRSLGIDNKQGQERRAQDNKDAGSEENKERTGQGKREAERTSQGGPVDMSPSGVDDEARNAPSDTRADADRGPSDRLHGDEGEHSMRSFKRRPEKELLREQPADEPVRVKAGGASRNSSPRGLVVDYSDGDDEPSKGQPGKREREVSDGPPLPSKAGEDRADRKGRGESNGSPSHLEAREDRPAKHDRGESDGSPPRRREGRPEGVEGRRGKRDRDESDSSPSQRDTRPQRMQRGDHSPGPAMAGSRGPRAPFDDRGPRGRDFEHGRGRGRGGGRGGYYDDRDRRDSPYRGGSFRDGPYRDGPPRDGPYRDGHPRDGSYRDGSYRDGPYGGRGGRGPYQDMRPRGPPRDYRDDDRGGRGGRGPFRDYHHSDRGPRGPLRDADGRRQYNADRRQERPRSQSRSRSASRGRSNRDKDVRRKRHDSSSRSPVRSSQSPVREDKRRRNDDADADAAISKDEATKKPRTSAFTSTPAEGVDSANIVKSMMGGPGGTTGLTVDQKKKLLWGTKKAAPPAADEPVSEAARVFGANRWDCSEFDSDKDKSKFLSLMGVKGDQAPAAPAPVTSEDEAARKAMNKEQERKILQDVEQHFVAGLRRADGRHVGLGL